MLIPNKYEGLEFNLIVLGADILNLLKKKRLHNIEELFQKLKRDKAINLERFYNTLCFLWLAEMIYLEDAYILLKQK